MQALFKVLVAIIALEHFIIMYVETFAWLTLGRKVFRGALPKELFEPVKVFANNLGIYNGFLAAGLVWSFFATEKYETAIFFLLCVLIAGLYGGYTAQKRIYFVQALPAAIAIVIWYFSK